MRGVWLNNNERSRQLLLDKRDHCGASSFAELPREESSMRANVRV